MKRVSTGAALGALAAAIRAQAVRFAPAMMLIGIAGLVGAQKVTAIKAGRVITISGADLAPGIIVAEDGRITAVGSPDRVKVPWNAEVLDASDRVVMPGTIEAHTSSGLDVENETMQTVPYLSVRDSINPVAFYFEDALRDGIVAMAVMPGHRTLVGGQGMVVKPHGVTVEAMTVKDRVGMKLSLLPSRNASRMSHMQKLRRYLVDFQDDLEERAEKRRAAVETARAKGEDAEPEAPLDPKKQPLEDLLDGKITAFVYCPTAADVLRAIELRKVFGLEMILVLGVDGYKAAEAIKRAKLPVVLDAALVHRERDPETRREIEHCSAAEFHKAGVPFALQTESTSLGARHLWFQAATAIRHGVPRAAALEAITLAPARMLGIDDRFGSIEVGKDLNVVVLTGDPLDYTTWVEKVIFEGKVIYDRHDDPKVRRLFKDAEDAASPAEKKPGSKEKKAGPDPGKKKPEKNEKKE